MASEKFLYVDPTTGFYTEDAASVTVYAGSASADRLVKTNSSGKIDNTLINFAAFDRVFSVRVSSASNITVTAPGATISTVTMNSGDRVLLRGQTTASENGIYVYNGSASPLTRALDYDENNEVHAGDLVVIEEGTFAEQVYILATNNPIVVGTTALVYTSLGTGLITDGAGLSYSGTTLNVNLQSLGGLKFIGDNIAVEPNDFAGLGLIDDGTDKLAIDFVVPGTNQNTSRAVKGSDLINFGANQGAKIIGYDKTLTAPYTTATTVQQAIDDAFGYAQAPGVLYTAATGGVTKASLVYCSAGTTAAPYSDANLAALGSVARNGLGLAATTTVAGSPVKVVSDSTVLTAVLTGATPGAKYYWTGTGLSTVMPTLAGSFVWEVGTAYNTTDLHVNVKYIKRNSLV